HPDVARRLLAVEKTREQVNDPAKDRAPDQTEGRARLDPVPELNADGSEPAKRCHKNAQHAGAEDADPPVGVARVAVKIGVVASEITVSKKLPKNEAHHQEQKSDGRDCQKNGEGGEPHDDNHPAGLPGTEGSISSARFQDAIETQPHCYLELTERRSQGGSDHTAGDPAGRRGILLPARVRATLSTYGGGYDLFCGGTDFL